MAAGCSCVRVTRVRGAGGEQVAELLRVSVLGEILEGIRRDKLLPAGPLKNILATNDGLHHKLSELLIHKPD